jgi:hypothetical protein
VGRLKKQKRVHPVLRDLTDFLMRCQTLPLNKQAAIASRLCDALQEIGQEIMEAQAQKARKKIKVIRGGKA